MICPGRTLAVNRPRGIFKRDILRIRRYNLCQQETSLCNFRLIGRPVIFSHTPAKNILITIACYNCKRNKCLKIWYYLIFTSGTIGVEYFYAPIRHQAK